MCVRARCLRPQAISVFLSRHHSFRTGQEKWGLEFEGMKITNYFIAIFAQHQGKYNKFKNKFY